MNSKKRRPSFDPYLVIKSKRSSSSSRRSETFPDWFPRSPPSGSRDFESGVIFIISILSIDLRLAVFGDSSTSWRISSINKSNNQSINKSINVPISQSIQSTQSIDKVHLAILFVNLPRTPQLRKLWRYIFQKLIDHEKRKLWYELLRPINRRVEHTKIVQTG